eukprot:TRINITY_DN1772_c0_g2_i1.p1 TRINITY_DN1772_c0_g2~~TRINITY_DN1772_c0_g2_i1.p1  ORF type:complete len:546 (-),score=137.93 TRINITY_DN1772_c0_g2_i1:1504-3141(-)
MPHPDLAAAIRLPSHSGYLLKLGHLIQRWRKRYFKLIGAELYYFKTDTDGDRLLGIIRLDGASLRVDEDSDLPSSKLHSGSGSHSGNMKNSIDFDRQNTHREGRQRGGYSIYIIQPTQRTYQLQALTEDDYKTWLHALQRAIRRAISQKAQLETEREAAHAGFLQVELEIIQKRQLAVLESPIDGEEEYLQARREQQHDGDDNHEAGDGGDGGDGESACKTDVDGGDSVDSRRNSDTKGFRVAALAVAAVSSFTRLLSDKLSDEDSEGVRVSSPATAEDAMRKAKSDAEIESDATKRGGSGDNNRDGDKPGAASVVGGSGGGLGESVTGWEDMSVVIERSERNREEEACTDDHKFNGALGSGRLSRGAEMLTSYFKDTFRNTFNSSNDNDEESDGEGGGSGGLNDSGFDMNMRMSSSSSAGLSLSTSKTPSSLTSSSTSSSYHRAEGADGFLAPPQPQSSLQGWPLQEQQHEQEQRHQGGQRNHQPQQEGHEQQQQQQQQQHQHHQRQHQHQDHQHHHFLLPLFDTSTLRIEAILKPFGTRARTR